MGDFNKKEYDVEFLRKHYARIALSVRKEQKAAFDAYCTKIGVKPTAYILDLVNADAAARGEEPPFKRRIK